MPQNIIAQGARLPALSRPPEGIASVHDYAKQASARLLAPYLAYLEGGSGDEITLTENTQAFQRIHLRQRILRSPLNPSTQATVPGLTLPFPVLLAPIACHSLAHPEGELATAAGAAAMGIPMIVSAMASKPLELVASHARSGAWFQLYMQRERKETLSLVQRAEAAGYSAIVLTVDAPVTGPRNREQREGFGSLPEKLAVNLPKGRPTLISQPGGQHALCGPLLEQTATWEDLDWLLTCTPLPVLLKGVTDPEDAERAIQAGVAGLIVSNHGGRTLDTLPATIDLLPDIAQRAQRRVCVLMDGGVRRGTDIVKALALGADAVMIGRPYMYGLATAGAAGVAHVLHILRTELEMAMALAGVSSINDIDNSVLYMPQKNSSYF